MIKKKIRYTFEGKNEAENIIWGPCFVRIRAQLICPVMAMADENGGRPIPVPGDFVISQSFTMYDNEGEARAEFNQYDGRQADVVKGRLVAYDGCGAVLEQWDLDGVKMDLLPGEHTDDNWIEAEWSVSYQASFWQKHKTDVSDSSIARWRFR